MTGSYEDRDGWIWMDGKMVEWRKAQVHVLTHALHYASSVFEGERCYNGRIFKGVEHAMRLRRSAELLDMEIPWSVQEIEAAKYEMLRVNGWRDAYVRAVAFRGAGDEMGVSAAGNPVRLAIAGWEWGAYYGEAKMKGAKLDISKWRRPDPATIPSEAKAAGLYMICTMAKMAAESRGYSDAMMLDWRGYVAEATGANVFFVQDGVLHTPRIDAILDGITRQTIIEMAKARGVEVVVRDILPEELSSFSECFVTGTAAEVTPVSEIGEYRFTPGALSLGLMEDYGRLVRGQL